MLFDDKIYKKEYDKIYRKKYAKIKEIIYFNMTQEMRKQVEKEAKKQNISISEFVLNAFQEYYGIDLREKSE